MRIHSKISTKIARTAEEKRRSEFFRVAIQLLGKNQHAVVFEEASKILLDNPQDAEMWNLLGVTVQPLHGADDAEMAFHKAVELNPRYQEAWLNLGTMLANQHRLAEALGVYETALALGEIAKVRSDILFIRQKLETDPNALFAAHKEFGRIYGGKTPRPFRNTPDPRRRLKIGYVSGDLREHSVAFFINPILACHDHGSFEIHAFSNGPEDYVTTRLKPLFDSWHDVRQLSDEKMADLVRTLQIDILVDLSGHTALNRLPVFGRRAAPVQVSWFGYMATTGLEEMDYRLTDGHMIRPESQPYYTEQLYFLTAAAVWSPAPEAPLPAPPPCIKNGHITFASLNSFAKVSDDVLATWAQVLDKVPDAVLIIVAEKSQENAVQDRVRHFFDPVGASNRLVFAERRPLRGFLDLFEHIDICLDPFPYTGGTTTLHALWAGVPTVTMAGESEIERAGEGILANAGLEHLAARSRDGYVRIAMELAGAPQLLQTWRHELRSRLQASPIMGHKAMTENLEAAYHDMFARYCAQYSAPVAHA